MTFLVPMAFASTGSAQPAGAGDACVGTVCGLGGQLRAQIGEGLPLPISIAPAQTGPFADITIQTAPATPSGLPLIGQGLGQEGQIKPTSMATIMQTTAAPHAAKTGNPRAITAPPGLFQYDRLTEGSIGVVAFNNAVFAVQTNLIYDNPHPGTDANGNPVPGLGASAMYSAGGRSGLPTVTFCAGATGTLGTRSPDNNWLGACTDPGNGIGINGLARFTKTANQFGGAGAGRTTGTAKVYFNKDGLALINLPCTGCEFQLSEGSPQSTAVFGGAFGGTAMNPAFQTPTGVYTGTVGFNGTILGVGNAVTVAGAGIYFTGQAASSVGFPNTTGRLTISVTSVLPGEPVEIFKRTGIDARDANGNGVVAMVTGAMSARSISKGNANRGWVTYEIPEPSSILAASAGLLALFGCNRLARRRSRS